MARPLPDDDPHADRGTRPAAAPAAVLANTPAPRAQSPGLLLGAWGALWNRGRTSGGGMRTGATPARAVLPPPPPVATPSPARSWGWRAPAQAGQPPAAAPSPLSPQPQPPPAPALRPLSRMVLQTLPQVETSKKQRPQQPRQQARQQDAQPEQQQVQQPAEQRAAGLAAPQVLMLPMGDDDDIHSTAAGGMAAEWHRAPPAAAVLHGGIMVPRAAALQQVAPPHGTGSGAGSWGSQKHGTAAAAHMLERQGTPPVSPAHSFAGQQQHAGEGQHPRQATPGADQCAAGESTRQPLTKVMSSCPNTTAAQAPAVKPGGECAAGAELRPPAAAAGTPCAAHQPAAGSDEATAAQTGPESQREAGTAGQLQQAEAADEGQTDAPAAVQHRPDSSSTLVASGAAPSGTELTDEAGPQPSSDNATVEVTSLVTASSGGGTSLAGPLSPPAAATTADTQRLSGLASRGRSGGAGEEVAGCEHASTEVAAAGSTPAPPLRTESLPAVSGAAGRVQAGEPAAMGQLEAAPAPAAEAEAEPAADEAESPEPPQLLQPQGHPPLRRLSKRMRAEMEAEVLEGWYDPDAVARRARVRARLDAGCSAADALAAWRGDGGTRPLSERLRRVVAAASALLAAGGAGGHSADGGGSPCSLPRQHAEHAARGGGTA
ncbi:hypothetical protein Rsub_00624 [Raphidocelis subcapitata]|uniref:Uncharacterized protein n=1 Tax=Raphidocelis subcapitata TaxID=307507 RepID=A0A2V0NN67_9CHLO|nr:hypothetical protein Rsub_00624 [Raphidocelis subcapitata]|eukprot:GBF87912.1 hypothetical protein Rsub_00624 [Raphidocelis subcapitata]